MRLFQLLCLFSSSALSRATDCKCIFGNDCWPSDDDFRALQAVVSQPLLYPVPPESACYNNSSKADFSCDELITNYSNGTWRADQPGSMQAPNWEAYIHTNGTVEACYLNSTLGQPCQQGSVPPIGVDAYSATDVQHAVRFATKHNLRLVIKNTGHDFLGRSTAKGSFLVWTHHMKNIAYEAGTQTLTLGSGVQWAEAYAAAEKNGRLIIGGISSEGSVGAAGGWILGGGHSALSPAYGLGVDNVVQFELVDALGNLLRASSEENQDLFWALRGGGGGTFGIVTSVTYKTHELTPIVQIFVTANVATPTIRRSLIEHFVASQPDWTDHGYGGYVLADESSVSAAYLAPNASIEQVNSTLMPFIDYAANITSGQAFLSTLQRDNYYSWYREFISGTQNGARIEVGSRLVSRARAQENSGAIADFLMEHPGASWLGISGGAVSRRDQDDMGLNPFWRDSVGFITFGAVFPEGSSGEDIRLIRQNISSTVQALEDVTGPGTYFNEAFRFEKDFKTTFFGDHYSQLISIKAKYDPKDLFVIPSGVGSERWDEDQVCRQ